MDMRFSKFIRPFRIALATGIFIALGWSGQAFAQSQLAVAMTV
jgi:hypothetical protein